jgi:hypothetical protein
MGMTGSPLRIALNLELAGAKHAYLGPVQTFVAAAVMTCSFLGLTGAGCSLHYWQHLVQIGIARD